MSACPNCPPGYDCQEGNYYYPGAQPSIANWHDCAHRADFASAAEHDLNCPTHGIDDDEIAYACDDCGQEFASRSELEGHEAEGCRVGAQ